MPIKKRPPGRPPLDPRFKRVPFRIRLPQWKVDALQRVADVDRNTLTEQAEEAITFYLSLPPPACPRQL